MGRINKSSCTKYYTGSHINLKLIIHGKINALVISEAKTDLNVPLNQFIFQSYLKTYSLNRNKRLYFYICLSTYSKYGIKNP